MPAQVPCYVLGIETQIGLSLVRELGSAGIPVIGIALASNAIGLSSRFLAAGEVLRHPRSEEGVAELRAIGERHGPGYLLTLSEANLSWVIAQRDRFGAIEPIAPSAHAFATVLDKQATLAAARAVGIDVPQSVCPATWSEVERTARTFPFPAVLKWADQNAAVRALAPLGIEFVKAEYVYDADEYLRCAARYRPLNAWPLVQQYCAGVGLGQFFFMHQGRAVRRFQHLRVAEWPPEGGYSSVCDALANDEFVALQEKSIQLLRRIGWDGVAMVEYRYDATSGRAMLMEVNGRFWGSYPLAMHCGAGFGLLAYSLQGQQRMPTLPELRQNVRCRMVATELKRLWRILREPEKIKDRSFHRRPAFEIARFLVDFVRPSVRYYVFSLRDLKPVWRDLRNMIGR